MSTEKPLTAKRTQFLFPFTRIPETFPEDSSPGVKIHKGFQFILARIATEALENFPRFAVTFCARAGTKPGNATPICIPVRISNPEGEQVSNTLGKAIICLMATKEESEDAGTATTAQKASAVAVRLIGGTWHTKPSLRKTVMKAKETFENTWKNGAMFDGDNDFGYLCTGEVESKTSDNSTTVKGTQNTTSKKPLAEKNQLIIGLSQMSMEPGEPKYKKLPPGKLKLLPLDKIPDSFPPESVREITIRHTFQESLTRIVKWALELLPKMRWSILFCADEGIIRISATQVHSHERPLEGPEAFICIMKGKEPVKLIAPQLIFDNPDLLQKFESVEERIRTAFKEEKMGFNTGAAIGAVKAVEENESKQGFSPSDPTK